MVEVSACIFYHVVSDNASMHYVLTKANKMCLRKQRGPDDWNNSYYVPGEYPIRNHVGEDKLINFMSIIGKQTWMTSLNVEHKFQWVTWKLRIILMSSYGYRSYK